MKIKNSVRFMLFGALLAPVVSCGWMQGLLNKPTKSEKHDNVPRSLLVGRIASVSTHGNFVLIESYGSWLVSPGTVLFSEDEDHMTSLQVTGEKLGQYAAADIRSGVPMVGDAVYQRERTDDKSTTPVPATSKSPPEPSKEGKSGSLDVRQNAGN